MILVSRMRQVAPWCTGAALTVALLLAAACGATAPEGLTPEPELDAIDLSPGEATLQPGALQQFSVTGRFSDGSSGAVNASFSATGGTISAAGSYQAGLVEGSYLVVASAAGHADTGVVTVLADAPPPPPPGGTFAPPDILTLTFDQAGDASALTSFGGSLTTGHHRLATGEGRGGSTALRIGVSGGSLYNPIGVDFARRTRVYVRWYYRFQGIPTGNVKGMWFKSAGQNRGEIYGANDPGWALDYEGQSIRVATGMYYGAQPQADRNAGVGVACANLADGAWHVVELDYDRNAGPNVELRVWCDGRAAVHGNGPAWVTEWGSAHPDMVYVGGDAQANTPTTLRVARTQDNGMDRLSLWETISDATSSAVVWIDDVAVSTQRIGP